MVEYLVMNLPGMTEENHKCLIHTTGFRAEIWSRDFLNTKHQCVPQHNDVRLIKENGGGDDDIDDI